ncbi:MAG: BrnA antitoxin family protein [Clostridia bacterium]|nr:BrnA antitoxin family protein [Clostridia bacterium]
MRDHYDFSKGIKNPYAAQLKKQVTINLDAETVDYFKQQAENTGIPYQRLINFYLADCVKNKRHLQWAP